MTKYIVAIESYVEIEADDQEKVLGIVWDSVTNISTSSEDVVIVPQVWYSVQNEDGEELLNDQIG